MIFKQNELFDEPAIDIYTPDIAGLQYIPNFIDAKTEAILIKSIDTLPWLTDLKRRVQHYGWRYDYKARNVTSDLRIGALPGWLQCHAEKLQQTGCFSAIPDQVIINEYQPGQGISAHIDCVPCFAESISIISLGSSCVMDFTNSKTSKKVSLLLEPCSLLVLASDARYSWQHAIAGRKSDKYQGQIIKRTRRISLTFRKVIL